MNVYITKKNNLKYKYLANWVCDGIPFFQWFYTLKELKEYTSNWNANYIFINK